MEASFWTVDHGMGLGTTRDGKLVVLAVINGPGGSIHYSERTPDKTEQAAFEFGRWIGKREAIDILQRRLAEIIRLGED